VGEHAARPHEHERGGSGTQARLEGRREADTQIWAAPILHRHRDRLAARPHYARRGCLTFDLTALRKHAVAGCDQRWDWAEGLLHTLPDVIELQREIAANEQERAARAAQVARYLT
jgi:hypothetical protein